MDYKKKIEIPFGAFDSELMHQEINIPNGFKAVIDENKIILTRAESEDEQIRKELTKHLKEGVEGYMPAGDSSDYRRWLDWLEKQDKSSDQIHYWTEEEIEPIISDYLRGAEHYGGMIGRLRCLKPKSLENQGEQKQKINNFDVLPGLYKCVHRMFVGTPDGRLLFEVGNVYKCLSKHDRAEFEVSYGHSVYLEDPVVCKHFIPFEKQAQKSSWSKEDDVMIYKLLAVVELYYDRDGDDLDKQSCIDWLKALKQRCAWKPSDEQMADLWNMLCECRPADHQLLQDIYYGLKKLKENNV